MKKSKAIVKKETATSTIKELCQRHVDRVLKPDVFFEYVDSDDHGGDLQEVCTLIDSRYADLLEEQGRSDGRNAKVNAELEVIEGRLKAHVFEALAERLR